MAIIKGTHSRPGQVRAVKPPVDPTAPPPAEVELPNQSFHYLTIDAANPAPDSLLPVNDSATVIKALKALGEAMVDNAAVDNRISSIPVVYTYFGQFIDHDITAGTDRRSDNGEPNQNMLSTDILADDFTPQPTAQVNVLLMNQRQPHLDLDSIYGADAGPDDPKTLAEGIYQPDRIRLALGANNVGAAGAGDEAKRIPNPHLDKENGKPLRDLPRHSDDTPDGVIPTDFSPRVGDGRNDENLIVAQFHTAFLHFHNAVVDAVEKNPKLASNSIFGEKKDTFSLARQIVRWTYQWLVVEDFLNTIARKDIVYEILNASNGFFKAGEEFMPLEFSVAAFRFGHSMVRDLYDFNQNFGQSKPDALPPQVADGATFKLLFEFTGKLAFSGRNTKNLPANWIIDWERFTDPKSPFEQRFAQKIDTNLGFNLGALIREDPQQGGSAHAQEISQHLAKRNLLRNYLLNIPTGQHVAAWLGVPALENVVPTDKPKVKQALEDGGLVDKTPLWYYILREAELDKNAGNSLGEVGSRLVAGTLIGLLKADDDSYLKKGWSPTHETAMRLPDGKPIETLIDFFRFAGVA